MAHAKVGMGTDGREITAKMLAKLLILRRAEHGDTVYDIVRSSIGNAAGPDYPGYSGFDVPVWGHGAIVERVNRCPCHVPFDPIAPLREMRMERNMCPGAACKRRCIYPCGRAYRCPVHVDVMERRCEDIQQSKPPLPSLQLART
jgi:hypothetical protein